MAVQPAVATALRDAAARLRDAGWQVDEVANTPPLQESADLQAMLWIGEAFHSMSPLVAREDDPGANAIWRYMTELSPAPDLATFQAGLNRRGPLLRAWRIFLAQYPVVIVPSSGEVPFRDGEDVESMAAFKRILAAQLTQVGLPLLGLPGLAVATGLSGTAPVGVQLIGDRYREDILLAAGEAIEAGGVPPMPIDPMG
jgi:amidase